MKHGRPYTKASVQLPRWTPPELTRPPRLIKLREVRARTGFSVGHVYGLVKAGLFPKSIPVGPQRVSWIEEEIDSWIEARMAERDRKAD